MLELDEQLRLLEDALASWRRGVAPGLVQLSGLPNGATLCGESIGHAQTVSPAETRHRSQKSQGHLGGDFALAHLLLHAVGQQVHQRQPPGHPTGTTVEATGQLIQRVAVALLQLLKQPALFQRRFLRRHTLRAIQQDGLGFAHRPQDCLDGVATQLLERGHALVAIDDQVAIGGVGQGDDDDGILLTGVS